MGNGGLVGPSFFFRVTRGEYSPGRVAVVAASVGRFISGDLPRNGSGPGTSLHAVAHTISGNDLPATPTCEGVSII